MKKIQQVIHKTDSRLLILGEPLNTYNFYHGTVRIIVDNSAKYFYSKSSKIPFHVILDLQENTHYQL